jgi:hypothetical protein
MRSYLPLGHINSLAFLIALLFLGASVAAPLAAGLAPAPTPKTPQAATAEGDSNELQSIRNSVEEVRRGQLNYKIEKDLLKEAYASNLQTLNIVITIVLATITVLGFLGLRSITSLRDDFRKELDTLTGLRKKFEEKLANIEQEQSRARAKVEELANVDQQQDRRLRILEIQDKAWALMRDRNDVRALEYIDVGLNSVPDNVQLLRLRAICLGRLGRLTEALSCSKKILLLEPGDIATLANLAECSLLVRQFADFDELLLSHRAALEAQNGAYLTWYLTALRLCLTDDYEGVRRHARNRPAEAGMESAKAPKVQGWHYDEARAVVGKTANVQMRTLMLGLIDFLEGRLAAAELAQLVGT